MAKIMVDEDEWDEIKTIVKQLKKQLGYKKELVQIDAKSWKDKHTFTNITPKA